ncbi:MAG: hypothetical protein LGR52_00510 [Candidatus Thiosymbion ectosymbiont of Robbea hypermnestra]|nr:hypothetical protein [Candidatus Thiosymbion ectosymbiont of Robbea hypermnestra]
MQVNTLELSQLDCADDKREADCIKQGNRIIITAKTRPMNRTTARFFAFFLLLVFFPTHLVVCADSEHHHLKFPHVLGAIRSMEFLDALLSDSTRAELHLDRDQIALMHELRKKNVSALCAFYDEVKGYNELGEVAKSYEVLVTINRRIQRDMMLAMTGSQRLRFMELLLHAVGWSSLLDADVAKSMQHILGLTPVQMDSLTSLRHDVQRQILQIFPATNEDIIKTISRIKQKEKKIIDTINPRVGELLTREQQTVLRRMAGKPPVSNRPLFVNIIGNPFQSCDTASGSERHVKDSR